MRPAADAPSHMKVRRAHLAYLNTCRLIGGGTFKVNLHAPGCGRTTTHESQAGALGIPEFMPPNRRQTFKVNPHACHPSTTMNERGFPLPLSGGCAKNAFWCVVRSAQQVRRPTQEFVTFTVLRDFIWEGRKRMEGMGQRKRGTFLENRSGLCPG